MNPNSSAALDGAARLAEVAVAAAVLGLAVVNVPKVGVPIATLVILGMLLDGRWWQSFSHVEQQFTAANAGGHP